MNEKLNTLISKDEPRINRIRRKYAENPEACHAILNMINQVGVREGVLEICCDENHSPNSRTDAILDYLNIPQDLIIDKETDEQITVRMIEKWLVSLTHGALVRKDAIDAVNLLQDWLSQQESE